MPKNIGEQAAYPLSWPTGWPRHKTRTHSRFGRFNRPPTVAQARDAILTELSRINIGDWNVVISTNLPLRRDGLPYSDRSQPEDTGASVWWKRKEKQYVMACDKYNTVGDNLWAIAKTIEATRGIERWGSVTAEQAFSGYTTLVEKTGPSCWETLDISIDATEQQILDAYRRKARETHPDNGGSSEAFSAVVAAKDIALATRRQAA